MVVHCSGCGIIIPEIRLELLPWTDRCVKCSKESRKALNEENGPDSNELLKIITNQGD